MQIQADVSNDVWQKLCLLCTGKDPKTVLTEMVENAWRVTHPENKNYEENNLKRKRQADEQQTVTVRTHLPPVIVDTCRVTRYAACVRLPVCESKQQLCKNTGKEVKKMQSAFVFINTEPASMPEVLKKVRAVEGVEEAEMVYGVYDIVAKLKTETMDQLKHIITYNIRKLGNVREVQTLLVTPPSLFLRVLCAEPYPLKKSSAR